LIGEEEERKLSPSLSISTWDRVLKKNGFDGIETEVHDCDSEEFYSSSVIMSTAISSTAPAYDSEVIIVTGSNTPAPPAAWLDKLKTSISDITKGAVMIEPLDSTNCAGKVCIFLGDVDQPILKNPSPTQFEAIKAMCTQSKGLIWVTRGGAIDYENLDASLIQGMLRTVRTEYAGKRMVTLDLDPKQALWAEKSVNTLKNVFKKIFDYSSDNAVMDFEFADRAGVLQVPRYHRDVGRNNLVFPDPAKPIITKMESFHQDGRPLRLVIGTPGLLDTIAFTDDINAADELPQESLEIEPKAFGCNFRDVLVAMGMNGTGYMGFECSGIIKRVGISAASQGFKAGDRVMALMRGHYSSLVRVDWASATHIPDNMSFEVAATLPHSYTAAYTCLYDIARIEKGEKILIHAATGGLGQAAIVLAKHAGAEIFATAGTREKRDFLVQKYGIQPDRVFSSRDNSFASGVHNMTGGKGVDVVLNTLSGSLLQESFNCVAQFGRFIELGKRDLELNSALEMGAFTRNVSFSSFDLLQLEEHRGLVINRVMQDIISLFTQGVLTPADPMIVYSLSEIERVFRTMQAGKHMGKIVITVKPDDLVPVRIFLSIPHLKIVPIEPF